MVCLRKVKHRFDHLNTQRLWRDIGHANMLPNSKLEMVVIAWSIHIISSHNFDLSTRQNQWPILSKLEHRSHHLHNFGYVSVPYIGHSYWNLITWFFILPFTTNFTGKWEPQVLKYQYFVRTVTLSNGWEYQWKSGIAK